MKWIAMAIGAIVVGLAAALIFDATTNPQRQAEWMQRVHQAAEQGNKDAQYELGYRYAHGSGIAKDEAEALRWFRLAAEQGLPEAQTALGLMYSRGEGAPRNVVSGYAWLSTAAAQGEETAMTAEKLVVQLLAPSELADARRRSEEYKVRYGGERR